MTVDPCRAVTAYAPPAMPISLTTVRSATIDTVTARPVLGEASGPDYGAGGRSWGDGGGCPGKCHGDGETMPEASPPIPARPRRAGSDAGAISLITLLSVIRFQRCLYHKIGAFNSKRAAKTA